MSYPDTIALKTLIEALPALASKTFITHAQRPAPQQNTVILPPYAVIHPADGTNEAERVTGPATVSHPEFTIWMVGTSGEQVQALTDLLKAAIFPGGRGVKVTVAGRANDRLWFEQPAPNQLDTSVTPPLPYAIVRCGWRSQPAA